METTRIAIDKTEARELYRKYKEHQHWSAPIDREIQRVYQRIAQGRTVIRAKASIIEAGVGDEGMPKLALARADSKQCVCRIWRVGRAEMRMNDYWGRGDKRGQCIRFPRGSFPFSFTDGTFSRHSTAMTPIIPVHLRPQRALQNYHILWEAEWGPVVPGDPMLLRRFGESDMWLVCAAWDLTEVEKAALEGRMNS